MERLKSLLDTIMGCVEGQMAHLSETDTKELGEAIDMIKDLEEAMYYCSIVKSMEEAEKEPKARYYTIPAQREIYYPYERDMDRDMGRMYYTDSSSSNSRGGSSSRGRDRSTSMRDSGQNSEIYYTERDMPLELHDTREGRSPMSRRNYMESKELHKGKEEKMRELEKYMKELTEDIVEMIEDASPEEKQMLEKKMTQLTSKISQLNV